MAYVLAGGRPKTFRFSVDETGGPQSLNTHTAELIFRCQNGAARLYWSGDDYKADANYVELNGPDFNGEFRLRAALNEFWMRAESGEVEVELTVIQMAP